MKKRILLVFILVMFVFLNGCVYWDINFDFIVQEFCENVNTWEYNELPETHQTIVSKYGMREIEMGYKNGKMKFVDYGW